MASYPPVLDGHNDTLLVPEHAARRGVELSFIAGAKECQIDLPRARATRFGGGFFACHTPDDLRDFRPGKQSGTTGDAYDVPLPPPVDRGYAADLTLALVSLLLRLEIEADGAVRIVRTLRDLTDCVAGAPLAMIMHVEGADCLDRSLDLLHVLHAAGVRSLGIAWSRPNAFANGVPFRFPSTPTPVRV